MRITLAEEIMLLSLDDESGSVKQRQSVGWAVAGALLLELVLAERVRVSGKYLELVDSPPTGEELLDGRIEAIRTWMRGRSKRRVGEWLTKDQAKAVGAAVERLSGRGVVVEERRKALGVFPVRRYPEADGTIERELRERLASAVSKGAEPDERTASLITVIHAAGLHALAFPGAPRKEITARTAAIADGQWAAESIRAAIRDMQMAMAVITVATVVSVS
ncbi:GPP34 family phosphoprotein [Streptomyces sp. NBC_00335]|uniref:GOLPH3/VPS74 family protein n=1 Tax=unclassified Streptomyces TaxID=2593676 RepID=UPI002250F8E0|nr:MULTISPECIES: GPP34 family phosphoprotein [unclassified Streptomyces]MCX5403451.1 GPP34 family phosphoprotein [Streptomyces sp. NBC_00086]